MTGQTTGDSRVVPSQPVGSLDDDSVERIDVHLKRSLHATDPEEKDFHIRHARQLLEACRQS
jgi:adenine C2-methylase RlmN of 23S rRNA A2503 and tRNA A37